MVALLLVLCGAIAFLGFVLIRKRRLEKARQLEAQQRARFLEAERKRKEEEASGVPLSLYFGSQTGTAEGFAKSIAQDSKKYGFAPRVIDLEDIERDEFVEDTLSLFFVATYGEGDPTDNAIDFMKFIKSDDEDTQLDNMHFSVFGLGNKQYEHYNKVGRVLNKRLLALGAKEVYPYGEGDDDAELEDDFETWRENLLPALRKHAMPDAEAASPDIAGGDGQEDAPVFDFESVNVPPPSDPMVLKSGGRFDLRYSDAPKGKIDLSSKCYFETVAAKVIVNRELRQSKGDDGLGSTMHIEIDLKDTGLQYTTADTLSICPENDPRKVEMLARWLNLDLDQWFNLQPSATSDPEEYHAPLFPTPCTVRTALACYCAINAAPSRSLLKKLAMLAQRSEHRKRLLFLSSKEGKDDYHQFVTDKKLTVCEIFESFPSIQPTIGQLVETLPRLQPRDYTISSSSKVHPNRIHVTASVVREPRAAQGDEFLGGVCTTFLERLVPVHHAKGKRPKEEKGVAMEWPKVYCYVRTSTFVLPEDTSIPLILIGPGTGLAPMRACLQERRWQREQGMNPGETHLFFGCKKRDEDFIYEEEILSYCETGDITTFYPAFSREQATKVYVQNRLQENGEKVWSLIHGQGAYVFVCGGTKMGKDVHSVLQSLALEYGTHTEESSIAMLEDLKTKGRYIQELWS